MISQMIWDSSDWMHEEKHLVLKDRNADLYMRHLLSGEQPDIHYVGVETTSYCNGGCSFCPASVENEVRPRRIMEEALFYRIISELKGLGYKGLIGCFNNNEPLLDARIYDFIEYAKASLPNATHYLYTNGTLLNKDRFRRLTSSLDTLIIDNYSDTMEMMPNIREIAEDELLAKSSCNTVINIRKKTQVLSSRAAYAPNKKNKAIFVSPCMLPYFSFYIKPEGLVSVCCQDVYGGLPGKDELIIADLNEDTIPEAWGNRKHKEIMSRMYEGGRKHMGMCAACDTYGFYQNFPLYYLHQYTDYLIALAWKRKNEGAKIYLSGRKARVEKLNAILEMHGLIADDTFSQKVELKDNVFVIFTHHDFETITCMDAYRERLGEKYIVFDLIEPLSTVYPKDKRWRYCSSKEMNAE